MSAVLRWAPVRWDAFKEMEDICERFNRLVGRREGRRESGQETMTVADWIPTVDILEDDKEFLCVAKTESGDGKAAGARVTRRWAVVRFKKVVANSVLRTRGIALDFRQNRHR